MDLDGRWAAVSGADLASLGFSGTSLAQSLLELDLAGRPALRPFFEAMRAVAQSEAEHSVDARALYERLQRSLSNR